MSSRPNDAQQDGESITLPLAGRQVSRCYVDMAFGIQFFGPGGDATIVIETAFQLRRAENVWNLSPGYRSNVCEALRIVWETIDRATVSRDGRLQLSFTDGAELIVSPDPSYESWHVHGPGDLRLIGTPGGGVAIFE